MTKITQCNDCGEPIVFLYDGKGLTGIVPVDAEGWTIGEANFDTEAGHVLHFDTCDKQKRED